MSEAEMVKLLAEAARAFLAAVNGATDAQLASGFLPPEAEDLRRALRVYDRSRPSQSDKRMSPEEAVRHLAAAIRGPGAGIRGEAQADLDIWAARRGLRPAPPKSHGGR